jgi:hypothetical protein
MLETKDEFTVISRNDGNYKPEGRGLHYRRREFIKRYLYYTDKTASQLDFSHCVIWEVLLCAQLLLYIRCVSVCL